MRTNIHRGVVTRTDLNCEGSIHISEALIEATTIHPFAAQKRNINNSRRIETYTLPSPRDSGEICMNRAAGYLTLCDDLVAITSFGCLDERSPADHVGRLILTDNQS